MNQQPNGAQASEKQPVFLLPSVITMLIASLWVVHAGASFALDLEGLGNLRIWFGFIALRVLVPDVVPGGFLPAIWSLFTHAFLHADWMHLIVNTAWLAIFGTPVARRYGTVPVLAVFLLGAAAGALVMTISQLADINQFTVLIGASGGVSALTGAAMRFVFQPLIVHRDPETGVPQIVGRRTASIVGMFQNVRSRAFILIWIGLNLAIPIMPLFGGADIPIAWQAHIGGFIAGLLLPSLFDAQLKRARAQAE